jgi:hypothetical protein
MEDYSYLIAMETPVPESTITLPPVDEYDNTPVE